MPLQVDPISKLNFRRAVIIAADTDIAPIWTKSVLPTLSNAEHFLLSLAHRTGASRKYLFRNISAQTVLEQSDGNWDRTIIPLAAHAGTSLPQLTAAFDRHVQPSFQACLTRKQSWRSWCSVLTWATGRGTLHLLMPMSISTLKGMIWDMMSMLAPHSVLKNIIDSIQSRHRLFGLDPPLSGPRSYSRFLHILDSVQGKQQAPTYPIEKFMIHQLLSRQHSSLTQFRNCLATVTTTIGMFRPDTGRSLQSCDVFFNADALRGFKEFTGCANLNISRSKTDQTRKGHTIRFGRSKDRSKDVVYQLGLWMDVAHLRPRSGCQKSFRRHARCSVCPPLFPKLQCGAGGQIVATNFAMSASSFSEMIPTALSYIGIASPGYSGKSAKIGGMSIAADAGVPEYLIWMQSGHTGKMKSLSARGYITLSNTSLLYSAFNAFGL
jgi:hypothetical protein